MIKYEVFWKNPHHQSFPYLHANTECDYLIVGGGVAGVSMAYFFAKVGRKNVILAEKNIIAHGATGHAAGSLVASAEVDMKDLVRNYGTSKSVAHWRKLAETIEHIKHIIRSEKIRCDFEEVDTLYCGMSTHHEKVLEEEYKYLKKIDPHTQILTGKKLRAAFNSPLFTKSILSPRKGVSVNPMQFTQNLAKVAARKGITIFEHTPVTHIVGNVAHTPHGTITFKKMVWAIDAAHPDKDVQNNKTTILITRPLTTRELALTHLKRKKIIWDAKRYYGYAKVTKENRLLIGVGDTKVHKHYNRKDPHYPHMDRARRWIRELFPYLRIPFEYAWSATYGVTPNHRLVVEQKGNQYAIAGAGSQVLCVMAAREIVNKIVGKPHRMDLVYL